jgi:iron-sulfur cluster assembly accessory protein
VPELILTAAAVQKVESLLAKEGRADLRLRMRVRAGNCSGLRYQLYFDTKLAAKDAVMRFGDDAQEGGHGVEVVIDHLSLPYLIGATIYYVDTPARQGLVIDNPNAEGSLPANLRIRSAQRPE